ncbi:MAG: carbon storage regulator CsrA [Armatimonadota bacterium]
MLVLSRKTNEQIVLGDAIEITVVEIRGDRVRLGIKAPPGVPIHRVELLEKVFCENVAAIGTAQSSAGLLGEIKIARTSKEQSA